ncbi:D-2-hydroxyacid dehydrogenase [Gudongella oleilytica]|jgi:glycerate dehydrogenase|uniref:D-2-hydroxyacid dehydrogenase n=1 Tax=Gudongella oleilytica TaxID=1582259 RepID=UPI002A35A007|nr:D-2-hydroxyacid dehydrogenase [Gudongella oleilytica]MDY0256520.1 D-2-hydroxyacid dehydrogenase [Gudongella oleilytica]
MKIVVLDGYTLNPGDLSWEGFEKLGDLKVYDRTAYDLSNSELVIDRGRDADAILLNKTLLNRDMMDHMPYLKYVGVLATGFNIVDVEAAREKGITVTNIPTYGTNAVAQMAIALLLELCHHVGSHSDAVANGEWESNPDWSFWKYPLVELAGKTMGIIGYGRIGRTVGGIAKALGMKVIAMANSPDPSLEDDMMRYGNLEELLRESDVISLHCPLTESTQGIINKDTIAKMKDGVMIINNSRGQLIVEEDLRDALNSGKVVGAALDVVSSEPIKSDNPLLQARNCIITPHISWAPKEARTRLMDLALENLKRYLEGSPINVVNK